jgi:hypothetical protein
MQYMDIDKLDCYLTPAQIFGWAKANLSIIKLNEDLDEDEITRLMRWIGECSYDTIFIDGDKAHIGRHGIGLMLSVTLMEFSRLYEEWELSQYN